ncbi:MAG TPA: TMEM175 family protein [Solirubrobacterales bacterium]|nr:TMEM175 family protein [Solirubrobacterales bacterium]
MNTNRLEAFSDGVFAIAITLLVLEIHIPEPGSGRLSDELAAQWPSYAAFFISFLTIGIIWINHHAMLRRLARADHSILIWNLFLLMTVSILPFTTALMAQYLKESEGESLAAGIYAGSFLLMGLVFAGMQRHILFRRTVLLAREIDQQARSRVLRLAALGIVPYVLATAVAIVSPYLSIAICGAVAVYYALPLASSASAAIEPPPA